MCTTVTISYTISYKMVQMYSKFKYHVKLKIISGVKMVWNYLAEISSALYLIVILIYSRRHSLFPNERNRFFIRMVGFVFITIILSIITVFLSQNFALFPSSINLFIHTLFFLVYPWISVLFFYYTLFVIYEDKEMQIFKIQLYTFVFIALYSVLVFLNLKYAFMFTIDQTNGYQAQTFEFLIFASAYIYMFLMLIYIELNRSIIDESLRLILITYALITSIFVTIQFFYPELLLAGTAAGLSILIMYLYIQSKELVSDYLTHLPNRVAYESIIKNRLKSKKHLNSMVVSLKDFKNVNNMYGQKNGDILLRELSTFFIELVGRVNVFRYSGDKFALLYYVDQFQTHELIDKIMQRFKLAWVVNDSTIYIESNIVHVNISQHVNDQFEAVSLIDYLNEHVKSLNSRIPIFSTPNSLAEVNRKAILSAYIKKALDENLFEIVIQPIFSMASHQYNHGEILVRLNHPTLGQISPMELIPIAEESGQIIELGLDVLKKALQFLVDCTSHNVDIKTVSVNFSVVQMNDANLIQDLKTVLDDFPNYVNKIVIEITESIFIADYQRIIEQMFGLNELGIQFYLDDFGTGYSNIINVIKLPLSVIKIDKSLIYESINQPSNRMLIHGLCDAFKEAGMKVLAEGIENEEQLAIVNSMPIDYIQGFLLSKPLALKDAIDFYKKHQV